jgi:hypothetical protein
MNDDDISVDKSMMTFPLAGHMVVG